MEPIVCNHCGATLRIDERKSMTVCPYCGTSFVTPTTTQKIIYTPNVVQNNNQPVRVPISSTKKNPWLVFFTTIAPIFIVLIPIYAIGVIFQGLWLCLDQGETMGFLVLAFGIAFILLARLLYKLNKIAERNLYSKK
jgi:hypothetical protein